MCKISYTILFVIFICSCSSKGNTSQEHLCRSIIPLHVEDESTFIHNRNRAESIVYEFYSQLNCSDSLIQIRSIKQALSDIKTDSIFRQVIALSELYLTDPNSPIKNEKLYLIFIDLCLKCEFIKSYDVEKFIEQRRLLQKNQIGTKANDFDVQTYVNTTLHDLCRDRSFKLLIFYDDDCVDCQYAIDWFSHNDKINALISEKKIKILAITDSRTTKHPIPESWIQCYSENYEEFYNILAVPSIYLLSSDNIVIYKDIVDMQELMRFLETI